jgi:penicillin-binding protein 2
MGGEQVKEDDREPDNSIGRRAFFKSMLGIKVAEQSAATPAAAAKPSAPIFFWADLKTGQIGFPTGFALGAGLPGSIMKLIAASALVETSAINPNHTVECMGHITKNHQIYHCLHPHGQVDLTHAIAKSCNVFFITACEKLTAKTFLDFAQKFGLDKAVAGRASGPFPIEPRLPSYMYALGLAADLRPNALQLLRLAALVGTAGDAPFLHSAEDTADGERFHVELKEGTWRRLQQGMELAVREGTAQKLDPENQMHIAAKTGTTPEGIKFQSWIIGYFPTDNPKHAFALNSLAGNSQEAAVPQAHKFLFATTWP